MAKKLLFVCLGNICRSPAAEAVMMGLLKEQGVAAKYLCDSAGTTGHHAGEKADARMRQRGKQRGYAVTSISRQVVYPDDFVEFDYILGMDSSNMRDLHALDQEDAYSEKLWLITDFCRHVEADHVPDPYYGGTDGFDRVLDILEDACEGLLLHLEPKARK